jgi:hypothetical protein
MPIWIREERREKSLALMQVIKLGTKAYVVVSPYIK